VRELVNVLERAAVMSPGDVLEASSLSFPKPRESAPGIASIDDHIRETLLRFSGKMELQEIADRLGLSRKTLWEKKKKWQL
jgi:transcriptional regulator of acetoin/glycerol metabolism